MKNSNFQEIKEQCDILTVARDLGIELHHESSNTWRGKSIFEPGNNETCLKIDTDTQTWFDFKAGEKYGGSVLDLVAFVKFGSNVDTAIKEAAQYLSGGDFIEFSEEDKKKRDSFLKSIETAHSNLISVNSEDARKALEYLHSRRITDETISARKIGFEFEGISIGGNFVKEGRLIIPFLDRRLNPVYKASRQLSWLAHEGSMKYHKAKQNNFLKNRPYGLDTIPAKNDECDLLIIGEGIFDALSFAQEGYKILFSCGGNFGKENEQEVIETAKRFRRVVLAYDSDEPGLNFTQNIGTKLLDAGVDFECIRDYGSRTDEAGNTSENKDVSDFYSNGGNLQELLGQAQRGYEFLASAMCRGYPFATLSANDRMERKKKARQFALKVMELPSFQNESFNKGLVGESPCVVGIMSEYFPKSDVEKFFKPKSRDEILENMRDWFLKDRKIFYYGSIKRGFFYEYDDRGFWVKATDAEIESELSEFFEHNIENKIIKDLMMKIRLKVQRNSLPEFNTAPVINFANGVYELETGIFRKAKPDDYLTFQFAAKYEPSARNERWERFLDEITCHNPERLKVIRNMLGYILFPDCRHHKMFFLIGKGRNGKSTLINILAEILKNINDRADMSTVTFVSPAKFGDDTKIIRLSHSLLNLCDDMKLNLDDVGEPLKTATAGGYMEGNFKFYDSQSFKNRAKIIACCQDTPTLPDTSFGLRERLVFINFENDFSKNPDRNIEKEILKNPEGIFAYIIECYRELIEQGEIATYRADQQSIMAEFIESSSGIAAFLSDYASEHSGETIRMEKVLKEYLDWCKTQGLKPSKGKPLNVKSFAKEVSKLRPDIKRSRDNSKGTFIFAGANAEKIEATAQEEQTSSTVENAEIIELHEKLLTSYRTSKCKKKFDDFIRDMLSTTIADYLRRPINYDEGERIKKGIIAYHHTFAA